MTKTDFLPSSKSLASTLSLTSLALSSTLVATSALADIQCTPLIYGASTNSGEGATTGSASATRAVGDVVHLEANCTTDTGVPVTGNGEDGFTLNWVDGDGTVVGQGSQLDLAGLSVGVHVLRMSAVDSGYGGPIGTFTSSSATLTITGTGTGDSAQATLGQLSAPLTTVQVNRVRNLLNQVQTRLRILRARSSTPAFDAPGVPLPDKSGGKDESSQSRRLGAYVMGLGDYFRQDGRAGEAEFKVNTKSLMLGADYRLNDSWVVGGALGLGRTDVRFGGGSQSQQDSKGYSGTAYVSWSVTPATYVSATLSHEESSFDIVRDNGSGSILTASAKGHGLGLSLSAGHDIAMGAWSFSPYVRWDSVTARIGAFDETGSDDAVSVGSQRSRSDTLNVGSQVQYSIPVSWGVVLPHARLELTRRTDSQQNSPHARLLNGNTALLIPTSTDADRSYGNWAIGVSSITQSGVTVFCDYEAGFALQGYRSQRITVGLRSEL